MIGTNLKQQVLFTRADLDSISQRCTTYIMQRSMDPRDAWKLAIEDEAQLIEHKLELMEEGALVWDWPSQQLAAMRTTLENMAFGRAIRNEPPLLGSNPDTTQGNWQAIEAEAVKP